MSAVYISALGAVSPAGWNMSAMRDALAKGRPLPCQDLARPGVAKPLRVLRVPAPTSRGGFLAHPRLRRASPITQFAVSAAVEAAGDSPVASLGVIVCVFSGCVNYSRRFYDETLKNPATASPLVFPETVFNAAASHIAAYLGTKAINYTLVGDTGTFLMAMALGAQWILEGRVERCVVVGTEEIDWLTSDALRLFDRSKVLSEGAGAIVLSGSPTGALARLDAISDEILYHRAGGKKEALRTVREQLGPGADALLCDSASSEQGISRAEQSVWEGWGGARLSPKRVLGEGLMAAAAWQVVCAVDHLARKEAHQAIVSAAGFHQHALGCRLEAL